MIDRRLSIAPMIDHTDRHYRYMMRLITQKTLLFTEMITTPAILHQGVKPLLFDPFEKPIALQLGGNQPDDLARCARFAESLGYDEINLNVGCPSDRVQQGQFGLSLMKNPVHVADCIAQMQSVVNIPVSVKCRIGLDHQDDYASFVDFIQTVNQATDIFYIHARKGWLHGLSPKQNRTIPPLKYDYIYQLKKDLPHLQLSINGGITSLESVQSHLNNCDGVMVGRFAYDHPLALANADAQIFNDRNQTAQTPRQVIEQFSPYIQQYLNQGGQLRHITRHLLNLCHGYQGAKSYRRYLTENAQDNTLKTLLNALAYVQLYES